MFRPFLVILLFCGSARADSVIFNDCGSLYYLDEVFVEGCSAVPCLFKRGSRQNFTFKLYAEFESSDFTQNAYFVYRGLRYPLEVEPETLCGKSLSCPVQDGQDASFTSNLNVNETLPYSYMNGELFWTTHNENEELVVCMQTSVTISE